MQYSQNNNNEHALQCKHDFISKRNSEIWILFCLFYVQTSEIISYELFLVCNLMFRA